MFFLKPPKELGLSENQLLQLLLPLYGLSDAGDYCGRTIRAHLAKDLGMKHIKGDIWLSTNSSHKKLKGMTGLYVDDSVSCGDKEFFEEFDKTSKRFNPSNRNTDNISFAGIKLIKLQMGTNFIKVCTQK